MECPRHCPIFLIPLEIVFGFGGAWGYFCARDGDSPGRTGKFPESPQRAQVAWATSERLLAE